MRQRQVVALFRGRTPPPTPAPAVSPRLGASAPATLRAQRSERCRAKTPGQSAPLACPGFSQSLPGPGRDPPRIDAHVHVRRATSCQVLSRHWRGPRRVKTPASRARSAPPGFTHIPPVPRVPPPRIDAAVQASSSRQQGAARPGTTGARSKQQAKMHRSCLPVFPKIGPFPQTCHPVLTPSLQLRRPGLSALTPGQHSNDSGAVPLPLFHVLASNLDTRRISASSSARRFCTRSISSTTGRTRG